MRVGGGSVSKVARLGGKRRRIVMQRVAHRDGNWRCAYCRRPLTPVADLRQPVLSNDPNRPTLDHVVPRSKGGRNAIDNFVLACAPCNSSRGNGA